MNLLPRTREEFSQQKYWNSFFEKRGNKAFEWYGDYENHCDNLSKYIKNGDNILISGCGNSTLGKDLFDAGFSKITCIDNSPVVITQMLSQRDKDRPTLLYLEMDALKMSFDDSKFHAIIDKGTLDALMPDDKPDTKTKVKQYFEEIKRVLRNSGRYVCISLLQGHILKALLDFFPSNSFLFRIVRCHSAERDMTKEGGGGTEAASNMAIFMVICTKFTKITNSILELDLVSGLKRYSSPEDVIAQIEAAQQTTFICSRLKYSTLDEDSEIFMDLYRPNDPNPRFTVYVVDARIDNATMRYAAFIVPQGRETEWLFSTPEGRRHLTKLTKAERLAIITLHRRQAYGEFSDLKAELVEPVCALAPATQRSIRIHFLSLGESDVGRRVVLVEGRSEHSGEYVVEDVIINGQRIRRLIYMSNQLVVQSEARVHPVKRKKGQNEVVDLYHLMCKHHIFMSIATLLAMKYNRKTTGQPNNVSVIGLGGGGLCSFLQKFMDTPKIVGVDIDSEMLKVAVNWFGLVQSDRLKVVIKDGLTFLKDEIIEGVKYDAVLLDVDNKDSSIGMSCPPQEFLADKVVADFAEVLTDAGFFIVNVVARDENMKEKSISSLKKHFKTIVAYKLQEELNDIYMCLKTEVEMEKIKHDLGCCVELIDRFFAKAGSSHVVGKEDIARARKIQ